MMALPIDILRGLEDVEKSRFEARCGSYLRLPPIEEEEEEEKRRRRRRRKKKKKERMQKVDGHFVGTLDLHHIDPSSKNRAIKLIITSVVYIR